VCVRLGGESGGHNENDGRGGELGSIAVGLNKDRVVEGGVYSVVGYEMEAAVVLEKK
jgi:hypothetical protein